MERETEEGIAVGIESILFFSAATTVATFRWTGMVTAF